MRRILGAIGLTAALASLAGCASRQPYVTPERLARGLVIVLPGIEGRGPLNEAICDGLNDAGVSFAIELCDWTSPWGPGANLLAEQRNRRKAAGIAERIAAYQWDHPDRPVILIGQSGGSAIAVWIAETLWKGNELDGIIMIAPSLSPGYLLDFCLARTRRGIVNFYSRHDRFLGMGTALAGTMDRYHTASAGKVGFAVPKTVALRTAYRKLLQIPWRKEMARVGHTGGHLSSGARGFVSAYLTPLVKAQTWDDELVRRILNREAATSSPSEASPEPSTRPVAPKTR